MFKSLKTRFFTQYHLFVFIVIFALKNPRNPCGLWDFTDVIYFGRQSWLRYRGTVRFTFFRPLLRFPKKTLAPDSAGKNFIFPPLRRTPFASRKRGSKIPVSQPEKTDTPVWVCPFAFIKFFWIQGYSALPHFSNAASVWRKIACARDYAVRSGCAPLRLLRRTPFASRKRGS